MMKNWTRIVCCMSFLLFLCGTWTTTAYAKSTDTILPGIYLDGMDLSGLTVEEAELMADRYVEDRLSQEITLDVAEGASVTVTPAELGLTWDNREVLTEAAELGKTGNIIARYKAKKDLQFKQKNMTMSFSVDEDLVKAVLENQCAAYNVEAEDASLIRENGEFIIHEGTSGLILDEEASLTQIVSFLTDGSWDGSAAEIALTVAVDEPQGSKEELSKVKDVLGSFETSFHTSGAGRSANVRNGAALIDGTLLYPGEEFSTYDTVAPFTESNGYYMAGSYLNGQVVDSLGGGICQVSTTLYNAVLLAELDVTERHNHSMIVSYVHPSADAAISESAGKDFRFVNNTDAPIYIEAYTTDNKVIGFKIYGHETRDEGHAVSYESEVVSTTNPESEVIYTDASLPIGTVTVQSAHIGYKANLWKVTYENGTEVSREMVNSSTYQMSPRQATVGVATSDENAYNEIMAAVATGSIDQVKSVAAALQAAAPAAEMAAQEAPAETPAAETAAQ